MNNFRFKAADNEGKNVSGEITAESETQALAKIREMYPMVFSIEPAPKKIAALDMQIGSDKVKNQALVLMCAQFSNMLRCGIQAAETTTLIANSTKNKKLKNILYDVAEEVKGGRTLASSFEMVAPKAFPITFYETIRAGEESGNVDESFNTLYKYYEKEGQTKSKIKSALIYPIFIIIIAIVVLIVVMTYVIPQLSSTFEDLGGELPGITKIMIGMSNFFSQQWWLLLIIIAVIIAAYKLINKTKKGMLFFDKVKMKIPVIGKISAYNSTAQFSNTLAMFIASGLPMTKALEILSRVFKNNVMRNAVMALADDVKAGRQLGASMGEKGCFLPTLVSMVENGEKTGNLEEMLSSIGEYYSNESDMAIKNALAKLEPAMLMVVAVLAGFIVLSIYLPIFQVYALL